MMVVMDSGPAPDDAFRNDGEFEAPQKEKGPTRVGPVCDFCVRSGPDDPGGLGAEESETERTGPTQYLLFPI